MNIIGLILCFIYIVFVLFVASFSSVKEQEIRRNIIHVGVCNYWFIATICFDNVYVASIGPIVFILVNYLSYRYNLIPAMERKKKDLGTVYYALSCLILTIISFGIMNNPFYGAVGVLILGYGDGFANIIGRHVKSKKYKINGQAKSVAGTLTMFLMAFTITSILSIIYANFSLTSSLAIALSAALLENVTPYKMDNLSVPIVSTLLAILLF